MKSIFLVTITFTFLVHSLYAHETNDAESIIGSMYQAIENDDPKTLMELIQLGADVHLRDISGYTTIHRAAEHNAYKTIPLLAELGVELEARNGFKEKAIHVAAGNLAAQAIEALHRAGARIITAMDGVKRTALIIAAARGDDSPKALETLSTLINLRADVHAIYRFGTALHEAAKNDTPKAIEILIEAGADKNAKTGHNEALRTPFHHAAQWDSPKAIEALSKAEADIDAQDLNGDTALHVAIRNDAFRATEALVRAGIDIHAENNFGETALNMNSFAATRIYKLAQEVRKASQKRSHIKCYSE